MPSWVSYLRVMDRSGFSHQATASAVCRTNTSETTRPPTGCRATTPATCTKIGAALSGSEHRVALIVLLETVLWLLAKFRVPTPIGFLAKTHSGHCMRPRRQAGFFVLT